MQSENKILIERIHREFMIAEKHLSRIEECVSLMSNMFPLSTASYSFLSSEEVRLLDQFRSCLNFISSIFERDF